MEKEQLLAIEISAQNRSYLTSWVGLFIMSMNFGAFSRLTWWNYSWDIMEPVTYFFTYGTGMVCYMYYLITRQEYGLPDFLDRQHLSKLHKNIRKTGFQLAEYNKLKDQVYHLETTLKIIRGPLYEKKNEIEQKRRQKERSSSSSSRSPSSSPSPSPSPERTLPKKFAVSG